MRDDVEAAHGPKVPSCDAISISEAACCWLSDDALASRSREAASVAERYRVAKLARFHSLILSISDVGRREETKEQTRQQLTVTALELFHTRGFDDTRVQDIVGKVWGQSRDLLQLLPQQ